MSDNIPYEIQMEIIKKVSDVKCLIRLRSVSKQWMSFIDSPEFIEFYGVRRHTQPHRLLLKYTTRLCEFKYISFIHDDVTFPLQQPNFAPNVMDLMKQFTDLQVIRSSCGLWCLHSYEFFPTQNVVIWNPAIRKSVGFGFPRFLIGPLEDDLIIGFGVRPSTYDPTIVVISSSDQVYIFTLSSKRMIPSSKGFSESVSFKSSTHVALDRFIYWIAYDGGVSDQRKNLILSFDLITHEFKEVDLPVSIADTDLLNMSISELNGSLVVSADEENEQVFGLWMMGEERGVMTSFTKLFNINTPDYTFRRMLLGFRKNGEPIMETTYDEELTALEVYEPCSENINNLVDNGNFDTFFICPYIETLLLIDQLDGFIEDAEF